MKNEHLDEKQLNNYSQGELPPREFLRMQTHLETCPKCQRRLDEMFPNIAQAEADLLLMDLSKENKDEFHLNYEEYLKPFIYGTINSVDKEIVESHVEVCAVCREDLRDLLNFHQELEREKEIQQLIKTGWWANLTSWFSQPNPKMVWLALAIILIFAGVGLIWSFLRKPAVEIAQEPDNPINIQNSANENVNLNLNLNQKTNTPTPDSDKTNNNQNKVASSKEPELANLVLPKFLNHLQPKENEPVRGDNALPAQKIPVISPTSQVIRDSSPVLNWQKIPNIESYEVTIFDEKDNRIAKVENIKGSSWRVPPLTKGKMYQWQVFGKIVSKDNKTTHFIGQGKFYIVSKRDENRIAQAKTGLEHGKALAEAGLLREATETIRQYLRQNPNSETAKRFLRQIEQFQK